MQPQDNSAQDNSHQDNSAQNSWNKASEYRPLIVAHRGSSADAPENTLAAFQLAWAQRADAIEGDFFMTADRQIVALHDDNTLRTTGVDWDVRTKTVAELSSLDAGRLKGADFVGQRIPTLEQVLDSIPPGKRLFLEIKDSPRIVPVLKEKLAADAQQLERSAEQIVIIAFDPEVIAACKQAMPEIAAMWLTSFKEDDTKTIRPTIDEVIATLSRIQADGLDCKAAPHIDESFVKRLRESGYQFHVWTVDDPHVAQRFIGLRVDSITTNVPAVIREVYQIPAVESEIQ